MIGFIGAMKIEIEGIYSLMTDKKSHTISGIEYVSGKLFKKEIVAAVCGVGKVFAAVCTQSMILNYKPSVIINTGVAGSLSNELKIGDIAIANRVLQHDYDLSPIGSKRGKIDGIEKIFFDTDPDISDKLSECIAHFNINTRRGVIASGDQFIASAEQKKDIVSNFGAIACEMECGSIGQVCHLNAVPFAVLRAISDAADGSAHVDFPTFAKQSAENYVKVVERFCQL